MNDCPNGTIRDLLPDLVNGGLADGVRSEVEAHVQRCVACREELALLRQLRGVLRRAPAVDAAAIVAALPAYHVPVRATGAPRWTGWRIAAAVTLLAAGGSSVLVARHGAGARADSVQMTTTRSTVATGRQAVVVTPVAESASGVKSSTPRELALAGGTISELDDSELSALIDDIGSLNAVTPVEVDNTTPVSPLAPNSPSGMND